MKSITAYFDKFASKDDPYCFRYFARPLSAFLLVFCGKFVSANQVTYIRIFSMLVVFILMAIPNIFTFKIACVIFLFNTILDTLDGAIARKNDNASYWGKFLDGYADSVSLSLLPFAGAIHILLTDPSTNHIFISILLFLATFLFIIENYFRERLVFYREWILRENSKLQSNEFFTSKISVYAFNSFFDVVHFLILAVIIFVPIKIFFIFIIFLYFYFTTIWLFIMFLYASKNLRIYKKSKFKAVETEKNNNL